MKKLKTSQKVVLTMGILGVAIGIFGKFSAWDYGEYFPFFYAGSSMMWIAFLPQKNYCCNLFKRKEVQKS